MPFTFVFTKYVSDKQYLTTGCCFPNSPDETYSSICLRFYICLTQFHRRSPWVPYNSEFLPLRIHAQERLTTDRYSINIHHLQWIWFRSYRWSQQCYHHKPIAGSVSYSSVPEDILPISLQICFYQQTICLFIVIHLSLQADRHAAHLYDMSNNSSWGSLTVLTGLPKPPFVLSSTPRFCKSYDISCPFTIYSALHDIHVPTWTGDSPVILYRPRMPSVVWQPSTYLDVHSAHHFRSIRPSNHHYGRSMGLDGLMFDT